MDDAALLAEIGGIFDRLKAQEAMPSAAQVALAANETLAVVARWLFCREARLLLEKTEKPENQRNN